MLATALTGCKEQNPEPKPSLQLSSGQQTDFEFSCFAESETITFSASQNWMIQKEDESAEWFTISPEYGSEGKSIQVELEVFDYNGTETLTGSFKIVSGKDEIVFSVTQLSENDEDNPYIKVTDGNFLDYLLENHDTDSDGKISKEEAAAITRIEAKDWEISSLDGIKAMTSLEYLDVAYNIIEGDVDLSGLTKLEECYIDHNIISRADLSGCSSLKKLQANDNVYREVGKSVFMLTTLNLEGCTSLEFLHIEDSAITTLDLAHCTNLKTLKATWMNLTSLDISGCVNLEVLQIRKNPISGDLDVSHCSKLQQLSLAESNISALVMGNHPELTSLDMYYTQVAEVDLTQCPQLKSLTAHGALLTSIDLSQNINLETIWLKFNQLKSLDVTKLPKLKDLQIYGNQVQVLDLSHNPELVELESAYNRLEEINLTGCRKLKNINLESNELMTIDFSDCSSLEQLSISMNKLSSINLSNSPKVILIHCEQNYLHEIIVDKCPELMNLWAAVNNMESIDLTNNPLLQEVDFKNNILNDINVEGLQYLGVLELQNNKLERLNVKGCVSLSELYVFDNPMAYLSVNTCKSLRQLDCRRTALKSIDLSNNPAMAFLFAQENPQMETIFIMPDAAYSTLTCDDHVSVYYRDPQTFDDVDSGNWGDEDLNPWA